MSNDTRIYERAAAARGPVEQVLVFEREWWMVLGEAEFKHRLVSMSPADIKVLMREIRAAMNIVQNKLALDREDSRWRRRAAACARHLQIKKTLAEQEINRRGASPMAIDLQRQANDVATRPQREAAHKARMKKQREERAQRLGALRDLAATDPSAAIQGLIGWLLREHETDDSKETPP